MSTSRTPGPCLWPAATFQSSSADLFALPRIAWLSCTRHSCRKAGFSPELGALSFGSSARAPIRRASMTLGGPFGVRPLCRVGPRRYRLGPLARSGQGDFHHPAPPPRCLRESSRVVRECEALAAADAAAHLESASSSAAFADLFVLATCAKPFPLGSGGGTNCVRSR
jgi:hypothetical protein